MSTKLRRFVVGLLILVILLAILGGLAGNAAVKASFPQTSGEIKIVGLNGPVDILRDKMGIPQIYAGSLHDLFMAQGYVHAQDRFWQMDFWRHIGSARLSEMFGKSQLDTDIFLRTLGWRQIAEQEYATSTPEAKAILDAYTEGVNAYLNGHSGTALSLEYGVLKLINSGYVVEAWTPVNSLTWAKAMAWDLRGNMGEEIERSILLKTMTKDQVNELFPPYPQDHPVIVPAIGDFSASAMQQVSSAPATINVQVSKKVLDTVARNLSTLDDALGRSSAGIGSNNWVISGKLTASGKPLLANDPHLSIQMPSIWYQIGLHCQPKNEGCPYEVAGLSFAGVPGVIIGHNDRIAWGFTNVGPDVMDLYIEKINPENPDQYEVNGKWVDMQVHTENIKVSGGSAVSVNVRSTRHGPVISDSYGPLKDLVTPTAVAYKEKTGLQLPENYAIALRWTALEPAHLFDAIWGFDKAQNWQEFRSAASNFVVPAQNLVFADVDGNIGYQTPGKIPIRKGGDGRLPVPGWTDDYEWTGYIPFEQLPFVYNPPEGFIATANNQVNPVDYPYLITADWDYGFRARRIVDLIQNAPGKIDIAYIQKMQGDDTNLYSQEILPVLMGQKIDDPKLSEARKILDGWDFTETIGSRQAAFFERFWWFLLKDTFYDQIPEDYTPSGGDRWAEVVRTIIKQPDSAWWDDTSTTDIVETRDGIFKRALADTVENLNKYYGNDPKKWPRWGEIHTSTFRNATLGKSGIAPIEMLFNRGPFETNGGAAIVNATGWDVGDSFEVNWLPSMRMIVDLGDLNNSITVHTTGESGHAYSAHYIDMADLWRNIQYYPMWWNEDSIRKNQEAELKLVP